MVNIKKNILEVENNINEQKKKLLEEPENENENFAKMEEKYLKLRYEVV